jgi:LacI family transcriptional regulator
MNRFKKKITIGDVASLAGVSKGTVSSVLNNKTSVSEETRNRVLEVIRKVNYQPNHIARSLSAQKTRSIGLIVKQIDNPYFTKIMRSVFESMSGQGYTILLGSSELQPEKERLGIETLLRQRADGLILSPLQGPGADMGPLSGWIREQLPLVLLERVPNLQACVVDCQNAKASAEAVRCLIGFGHRRIAYYAGPGYSLHNTERLAGFQQVMLEQGFPVPPGFVRQAGVYIDDGYRTAREHFSEPGEHPTAVFCFNDLVAIGVLNALSDLGIAVPGAVSIIGFDDIEFCESVRVPLSSVRVPALEMGKAAARLLLRQIEHRGPPLYEAIELEAKPVIRASCGPPPD